MSSTHRTEGVGEALFPAARRHVLHVLFGQPERAFYIRDLVRRTGLGYGHVRRELLRLHRAGILTRRHEGRHVYFQTNPECPVYEELRRLVAKTFGVAGPR